jgi:ATP-dependent helicase YprA (DUF1998 family)/very-short-patch-repair endonuclease
MNRPTRIPITKEHLRQAAELARECSSAAVRERVLVSQAAGGAVREYLSATHGLTLSPGRAAQAPFVELLDLADFVVGDWRVELRSALPSAPPALWVPTMPLMVGVLSDFYLGAEVDKHLSHVALLGFVRQTDLTTGELSANGLFISLPDFTWQSLEQLVALLRLGRPAEEMQLQTAETWQAQAQRILEAVQAVMQTEGSFQPEQVQRLVAGLRDDIWRLYGAQLPKTDLEPLLNKLFRRFGIASPVPAWPTSPLLFENSIEQQEAVTAPEMHPDFLQDRLAVGERVALYRHLLKDGQELQRVKHMRRALDRATGGQHQASSARRARLAQLNRQRRQTVELPQEPIPAGLQAELDASMQAESSSFLPALAPRTDALRNYPMNIFEFRNELIADYASYVKSFIRIQDPRLHSYVEQQLASGVFYPEPLIQLNPSFARGGTIEELVAQKVLHPECLQIFRKDKAETLSSGRPLNLHRHQTDAIQVARAGHNYVLTTGTGSGKSLSYIIPIVNHVLQQGSGNGIQAIVVYPMNALANSQYGELEKFLLRGYPAGPPVTFDKYTGQEDEEERNRIQQHPPDILLTNYVMLELMLTRPKERKIIEAARGLRFLVLDELHTYRGRQGADVALLVRRLRDRLQAYQLQCIGTSATIAGGGNFAEQRQEVARVATQLFGAEVTAEGVIMETLRRATAAVDPQAPEFVEALQTRLLASSRGEPLPREYERFIRDPLAIWVEATLGVEEREGRLVRCQPQSLTGAEGVAQRLSALTGVDCSLCETALQQVLLAGYECEKHPETGLAPFAFRLHQFLSRGDTVYATLEDEATRYPTIYGQQYKPGSRDHVLLPLVFCRECGQEYYSVRRVFGREADPERFVPRQLNDQLSDEGENEAGFLYFSSARPFPTDEEEILNQGRVPDDWIEERNGRLRVRKDRTLPVALHIGTDGKVNPAGLSFSYMAAPFRFCLCCGVSYGMRQRDDFAKLASLGSEGRSTATTITSLSVIRNLRRSAAREIAAKLLSFTDNRQDASLQAGHFNDFVETTLLRSALYRAVRDAGSQGLTHDELTLKVFDALKLPRHLYSNNPDEKFQALKDTDRALREVLGYRLYRDLERGWRITMPNLEQCGLLEIEYQSLDELSAAEEMWANCHPALTSATPEERRYVAKVLLDYMRRELTINVSYLDSREQERLRQQSGQRLKEPWAIDENEKMEFSGLLFARSRKPGDPAENTFLSERGGFGQFLRRKNTFPNYGQAVNTTDTQQLISDLLRVLAEAGLLGASEIPGEELPAYQLMASAMRWLVGTGERAFHDPIRMPSAPASGGRTNQYFVDFYRSMTQDLHGLEAHEHTAQVQYELREDREKRFRSGELPILYCSPTMELGVDIAELNVVNLRNVPPTPANYAQRSGRAGRSGQPALVFTYCTIGSPHDQYFFKRPERMVAGQVSPPRLDLANQDLVRAHVHAIWLAETGADLKKSLKDILDVSDQPPALELLSAVRHDVESLPARQRASRLAEQLLATIKPELQACDWYHDGWLNEVLNQAALRFDRTCDRWRDLYRSALKEQETQNLIILHASRSPQDKEMARRVRNLAEAQIKLLTEVENVAQSDFYSYRYFASEGFLPGYNFPRLPISAFIPARRGKQRDEFVSRPRFLAVSEFGPRAVVYHEGSRYVINKVILPVGEGPVDESGPLMQRAKLCPGCGYLHPVAAGEGVDLCERCGRPAGTPLAPLFRMQNVSTRRRDKISSDEEERLRLGYEIITGVRFSEHAGQLACRTAEVKVNGETIARLAYGQAATLWRINLGWARRKNKEQFGFVLDVERGYWKNEIDANDDQQDPLSPRTSRVIPYVEDTRNCLLFEPVEPLTEAQMASLQSALKSALQIRYQLEDNELAAEPLPQVKDRRMLLFYESSEGGAGILRRLLEDKDGLAAVALIALELCHYTVDGTDLRRAPRAKEDCEAACYDCLLSYYNQREHQLLDRSSIRDELLQLSSATVEASPAPLSRAAHLETLVAQAESELERQWLRFLEVRGYRLPSHGQRYIEAAQTRPDFVYHDEQVAIYVDGPVHDFPERRARDQQQTGWLEDLGYTVIRFAHSEDWEVVLQGYPHLFGVGLERNAHPESGEVVGTVEVMTLPINLQVPDWELFDERYQPLLQTLYNQISGLTLEPGGDVAADGRVIGSYLAELSLGGIQLRLVDADQPDTQIVKESLASAGYEVVTIYPQYWSEAIVLIKQALNLFVREE